MELSVEIMFLLKRITEGVSVGMSYSIVRITAWWQITSFATICLGMFSFAVIATSSLDYCRMCFNFLTPFENAEARAARAFIIARVD